MNNKRSALLTVIAALALGLTACSPKSESPAPTVANTSAPTSAAAAKPATPAPVAAQAAPATPGDYDAGKKTYMAICFACHQATGLGLPGAFPPLAGSEIVMENDPSKIIRIVLHGLQGPITVKGTTYQSVMPAHGPSLKDQQIADVLTYVRNAWGNTAAPVTVEAVAAARAATAARTTMWTWAELTAGKP